MNEKKVINFLTVFHSTPCDNHAWVAWVAWVACQHRWRRWCVCVGGVCSKCSVVEKDGVLRWMVCYYYYCYYWNTISKKTILNVHFQNKNKKIFQTDLKTDLKEEPDLNSRCCITWTGNTRILNMSESKFGQIWPDMCNSVNTPEHAWNITFLNKPEF